MRIDHVTINVTDMEAAEAFYRDALGLTKLQDVDMGDHELHYFDLGDGQLLELIWYKDAQPEIHPDVKTKGIFRHLALAVDDLDAVYRRIIAHGGTVTSTPAEVPKLHFRNILVRDPDGVELEIVQRDQPE